MMLESKEANQTTLSKIKQSIETSSQDQNYLKDEHIENYKQDRNLKRKHALWFMWILMGQLSIMNLVFICVGLDWFRYNHWTLELYMTGTLAQVFGIVLVMTKNLFPLKKH